VFGYYFDLAVRSLRRNVALTILMIVAIAFGVGASMTTLTVLHVLSVDPIPGKSHQLFMVQLDPKKLLGYIPGKEPDAQVTLADAKALLRLGKADRQAMMTGGAAAIEPPRSDVPPFNADGRWTTSDFFPMFRVPFLAGSAWTAADDAAGAHVAVLAKPLAEKLFGAIDVVGKAVRVEGTELRIVGVIDDWRPTPHFYDLYAGTYGVDEELFVPWETSYQLKLGHSGSTDCWDEHSDSRALGAPCTWLQFWVELGTRAKAEAYREFLIDYSADEFAAGRYHRPPNVRLRDVVAWLEFQEVVPSDARLQTWIALGFLLVCLVNTVGLLLTKFLRRSAEIGVRRALGASRWSIFCQLLIEAGTVGLAGGALGLGLAWLGLFAVRHQPTDYAKLAELDLPMLAATFGLAVITSVLAGLLPAWRGCQITPAIQLKSH
jgi:putative ABC transport system permease protein